MNYTLEDIRAAFQAAKKGILESEFIKYIEVHVHLHSDAKPKIKRGRKSKAKPIKVAAKPAKKVRARKGRLGEGILKYLQTKGATGAHVKDIATHLKTKTANITAWFYTTGKKHTKKVKPATFALSSK